LDRKIADLNERIEAEIEASGTTLTKIFGVGPILAARIIGAVGSVERFPSKAHFASYAGAAPLEASSSEVVRHRLSSLAGNRKLNYALHMVATCQARSDARGGTYYRKKIAEGKSRREVWRCLKRRNSDAVFREPCGRLAGTLTRHRLTKRSLELRHGEVVRRMLQRAEKLPNAPSEPTSRTQRPSFGSVLGLVWRCCIRFRSADRPESDFFNGLPPSRHLGE
jgi:hypothetical protein